MRVLDALKSAGRRIPGAARLYRALRDAMLARRLRGVGADTLFTDIYRHNRWGSSASRSGKGSDLVQTAVIARVLPSLLRELGAQSLLDVPCGDFHWMRTVELGDVAYIGADIVPELVARNVREFGRPGVEFRLLNLITDTVPRTDVVLCRDAIVHLSFADGAAALRNICRSGSTYLLATTFPGRANRDIVTGDWRPLDLEAPPYSLPPPLRVINEACTEGDGAYRDKSLGLWRLKDFARFGGADD